MVGRKKALMSLWKDTCTVTEYRDYTRENKSTGQQEVVVLENQPCKLSFSALHTADRTDTGATVAQTVKLFVDIELDINPGSKITVYHNGRTLEYKQSGLPGLYTYHREITLIPYTEVA